MVEEVVKKVYVTSRGSEHVTYEAALRAEAILTIQEFITGRASCSASSFDSESVCEFLLDHIEELRSVINSVLQVKRSSYKRCEECGKEYASHRCTSKYCSPACRKRAMRGRRK